MPHDLERAKARAGSSAVTRAPVGDRPSSPKLIPDACGLIAGTADGALASPL
jgi:hypothetical protein